jgi:quinoprotein glucose dehydrogenase
MRSVTAIVVSCLVAATLLQAQRAPGRPEWQTYAGDAEGRRYSSLAQINRTNVAKLTLAWQYGVADASAGSQGAAGRSQAVPIFVRGVLYTSTARRTIVALDPATGKEIWTYAVEKGGAPNRGVSYWPGDNRSPARIFAGTTDGRLLALDADTGKLIQTLGM